MTGSLEEAAQLTGVQTRMLCRMQAQSTGVQTRMLWRMQAQLTGVQTRMLCRLQVLLVKKAKHHAPIPSSGVHARNELCMRAGRINQQQQREGR